MRSIVWDGDIRVSQPFGCTDYDKEPFWAACKLEGGHKHCGIDIALDKGSPLRAARAGKVTVDVYGWLQVRVSSTQTDNYVHIDRSLVTVGAVVARGQLIAYSGDKAPAGGFVDGSHLHFEIQTGRLNFPGTCLPPVPVLEATEVFTFEGNSLTPQPTPLRRPMMLVLENAHAFFGIGDDDQLYITRYVQPDGPWVGPVPVGTKGSWVDYSAYTDRKRRIDVVCRGTTHREAWHCWSGDSGATFSQWELLGGSYKSPLLAGGPEAVPAASSPTDLSPVLAAIASSTLDLKAAMANLKITGGGLTTDQDAHLSAAEAATERIEAQLATGLQITGTAKA